MPIYKNTWKRDLKKGDRDSWRKMEVVAQNRTG